MEKNEFICPVVYLQYIFYAETEGINSLLSQSDFVNSFWDDKTKLTKKMVTTILKEISDKEVYF